MWRPGGETAGNDMPPSEQSHASLLVCPPQGQPAEASPSPSQPASPSPSLAEDSEPRGQPGSEVGLLAEGQASEVGLLAEGSSREAGLFAESVAAEGLVGEGLAAQPLAAEGFPAQPSPAQSVPAQKFGGLNGARLLASCHIVLGHLYQSGFINGYFFSWGFTWVPLLCYSIVLYSIVLYCIFLCCMSSSGTSTSLA